MQRLRHVERQLGCAANVSAGAQELSPRAPRLSKQEVASFMQHGYLVLPEILSDGEQRLLRQDVDLLKADQESKRDGRPPFIVGYEQLGKLCTHPAIMVRVKQLMSEYGNGETSFAMHHIHADSSASVDVCVGRTEQYVVERNRHQDYHCAADCHDRDQLMVHVFFYFNGLNGTVGDLLALPGSQYKLLHGIPGILSPDGEPADVPGSQIFGEGNPLPSGTAVIVHSGLMHARRAKPGFVSPRYFVDISYCQPGPHRWPAYGGHDTHERIFQLARSMGHDRDGEFAHVFDHSIMYTEETASASVKAAEAQLRFAAETVQAARARSAQ